MNSQLTLIRHGKTLANEQHLYCGSTDLPLSENGKTELAQLKEKLSYHISDYAISSGLLRANETLELLTGHKPDLFLPGFAEYNFGQFEMQSYEQLKDRADYQAWITDETGSISCPDGESKVVFNSRVNLAIKQLLALSSLHSSLFVVCHGGVIVRIMQELTREEKNFYEWQPEAGRGYILTFSNGNCIEYKTM